ncbi:hypothetical protein D5018_06585 [Parashewanella curva]|uniref:AraC family transcriptional regulator n=1 Tax=Parashewanella curva TaxID=2338552 RepID=A0A3L8PYF7_9GAMM|nr:hypothetical protein [Parashewanella curva]RLV60456.1 hypothetical protein D5018_06585 [Parashewanella curva]
MSLSKSLLTTVAIFMGVWFLLLFQPAPLEARITENKVKPNQATKAQVTKAPAEQRNISKSTFTPKAIAGVTKRVRFSEIPNLWDEFFKQSRVRALFSASPQPVFVMYQDISPDYTEATITIGVDARKLGKVNTKVELPLSSELTPLLTKGSYTQKQLRKGWQKINYDKPIDFVLEVNFFDADVKLKASELFVHYQ